jgi:hypothetical protein
VTRTIGGCPGDSLGVNKSCSKFQDVVVSGVGGRGRFDREGVNEFLLTIPFFIAGTGESPDRDGLTMAVEFTTLFSIGTSNFSGRCGSDGFSDSGSIFASPFAAGASW